ncbi:MAG: hypothetical protein GEU80_03415 [Dehalococcoidia bacterium]|nr:hypothetical protein [Dehalococcoidia bacterium]
MVTRSPQQVRDDATAYFREPELPAALGWVHSLSPLNQRLFTVELADALKTEVITGELDALVQLVEDWQATAELDAAPEVRADVQRPKEYRPLRSFSA